MLFFNALGNGFPPAERCLHKNVPGGSAFLHHIQEQIDTAAGNLIDGLFHCGQAGNGKTADINTVKTDDADIIGYGFSQITKRPDCTDRADDEGRRLGGNDGAAA